MRQRKRERRTTGMADCRLRISEGGVEKADWMAHRMTMRRMANSMIEKAQSSTEPKATGVKISKRMRISLMRRLDIVIKSLSNWVIERFFLLALDRSNISVQHFEQMVSIPLQVIP